MLAQLASRIDCCKRCLLDARACNEAQMRRAQLDPKRDRNRRDSAGCNSESAEQLWPRTRTLAPRVTHVGRGHVRSFLRSFLRSCCGWCAGFQTQRVHFRHTRMAQKPAAMCRDIRRGSVHDCKDINRTWKSAQLDANCTWNNLDVHFNFTCLPPISLQLDIDGQIGKESGRVGLNISNALSETLCIGRRFCGTLAPPAAVLNKVSGKSPPMFVGQFVSHLSLVICVFVSVFCLTFFIFWTK